MLLGQFSGFAGSIAGRQSVMPATANAQRLAWGYGATVMSDASAAMLSPAPREWTVWADGFGLDQHR